MKKMLIRALVLGAVVLPYSVFAAYNDVSLTTDTVITAGGINLNVAGSADVVQSIEVANDGNSFTVELDKNSTIKVTSSDRRVLTTDAPAKYIITNTCTSSLSTLEFASYSALVTIKVTPESTTCTITTTSSTGGTRSSGGSGGAIKKVGAVIVPATATTPKTVVLPAAATFGQTVAKFARDLKVGSTGADVIALQTIVGVSPATGYFGSITKAAVQAYQTLKGISATGQVGPLTRASLNASPTTVTTTTTTTTTDTTSGTSVKYTRPLKIGSTGDDVKQLQQFLNANGFTIASSGVGSPGNETNYMGKLTVEAIKKFQVKYEIASSGTPETTGYGALGPKTRAKLNELIGQ